MTTIPISRSGITLYFLAFLNLVTVAKPRALKKFTLKERVVTSPFWGVMRRRIFQHLKRGLNDSNVGGDQFTRSTTVDNNSNELHALFLA